MASHPPDVRSWPNPCIRTRAENGLDNGFLVPIYNVHDDRLAPEQRPEQVYLTVVAPRSVKGPHLHLKRWGLFTCISGNVTVVVRTADGYREYQSGERHQYATIQVPAGVPAALRNDGDVPAMVLNMPAPAWRADDTDEHPVSFDDRR